MESAAASIVQLYAGIYYAHTHTYTLSLPERRVPISLWLRRRSQFCHAPFLRMHSKHQCGGGSQEWHLSRLIFASERTRMLVHGNDGRSGHKIEL